MSTLKCLPAVVALHGKRHELILLSNQLREEHSQLLEMSNLLKQESKELSKESRLLRDSVHRLVALHR